jgi:hypothetical protein
MNNGHYNKSDGKTYRYKVVWYEDENSQPLTAFGDSWYVTGSSIVFNGTMGDIVFTPSIKMIIK